MGNKESLGRGSVQYLSAGTGITHSEMNDGGVVCRLLSLCCSLLLWLINYHSRISRFLQIWIMPAKRGEIPQYGSSKVLVIYIYIFFVCKIDDLNIIASTLLKLVTTRCFKSFVGCDLLMKLLACRFQRILFLSNRCYIYEYVHMNSSCTIT